MEICDHRKAHGVVKKNYLLEVGLIEIKVKHGSTSVANLREGSGRVGSAPRATSLLTLGRRLRPGPQLPLFRVKIAGQAKRYLCCGLVVPWAPSSRVKRRGCVWGGGGGGLVIVRFTTRVILCR